jgi:hypothetical protein
MSGQLAAAAAGDVISADVTSTRAANADDGTRLRREVLPMASKATP